MHRCFSDALCRISRGGRLFPGRDARECASCTSMWRFSCDAGGQFPRTSGTDPEPAPRDARECGSLFLVKHNLVSSGACSVRCGLRPICIRSRSFAVPASRQQESRPRRASFTDAAHLALHERWRRWDHFSRTRYRTSALPAMREVSSFVPQEPTPFHPRNQRIGACLLKIRCQVFRSKSK